jgi:hypothetical protein
MAIKKYIAMRLRVINDSQGDQQEKGLPVKVHLPPVALLLVAWESYMTRTQPEHSKTPPQTNGSSYFLIEKLPKTVFLNL